MFKNNSYFAEGCNYSFREDDEEKENIQNRASISGKNTILQKLSNIQKLMLSQYQVSLQNRQMLQNQANQIVKLESKLSQVSKHLGLEQTPNTTRMKSTSTKTCRRKKSVEHNLLSSIEERKKVINQELTKRINDQLQSQVIDKKPLKFFMPNE